MRQIFLKRILPGMNPSSGERWITADFHIHSIYSGGSLTPAEILKMAQNHLLDAVAISDHEDIRGAEEAQELTAGDSKLPLIVTSQEISLGNHFHFLLIGGRQRHWEEMSRNDFLEGFSEHHNSGGAIILAHPWTMPKSCWANDLLKALVTSDLLDAVELFNSSILELPPEIDNTVQAFWEEWVAPYNLGIVGGSDFHYHRQGRYPGLGRTYLKIVYPGTRGIIEALRKRRCVAGLFSCRAVDLGWLGAGHSIILGNEPWYGELQRLARELYAMIKDNRYLKPNQKLYLNRLMENGNYQMVRELLM